jgi:pimeloyl-ACP methyl ester carboxylesterase
VLSAKRYDTRSRSHQAGCVSVVFVLVHSPSVGPSSWAPVSAALERLGAASCIPSLLGIADTDPPFWPQVIHRVTTEIRQLPADTEIVLVAHSNAGLFVPLLVDAAPRRVAGCVFVDASVAPSSGQIAVAEPEMLTFLQPLAVDGVLPPWTRWWPEDDVAVMFPDEETRAAFQAEEPRLPLSYYQQQIPIPPGWDDRPGAFLRFGPAYDEMAAEATKRGWPVATLAGEHLHQLVDPAGVASQLVSWASQMTAT